MDGDALTARWERGRELALLCVPHAKHTDQRVRRSNHHSFATLHVRLVGGAEHAASRLERRDERRPCASDGRPAGWHRAQERLAREHRPGRPREAQADRRPPPAAGHSPGQPARPSTRSSPRPSSTLAERASCTTVLCFRVLARHAASASRRTAAGDVVRHPRHALRAGAWGYVWTEEMNRERVLFVLYGYGHGRPGQLEHGEM